MSRGKRFFGALFALGLLLAPMFSPECFAQQATVTPNNVALNLSLEGGNFSQAVSMFLLITALSLVPSFIMMMTSFLRLTIVLSILKQALGTQQIPSPSVIGALALFLTLFIMQPVWSSIYENAVRPYSEKKIDQTVAIERGVEPIKGFMLRQTRDKCLLLFMELADMEPVESAADLPMHVVIPAFMLSELKTGFQIGFLLYLPFLLIDVVVATVLMSMGMMMLPPVMISLPFKLLLFVVVDGWELVIKSLVNSFQ